MNGLKWAAAANFTGKGTEWGGADSGATTTHILTHPRNTRALTDIVNAPTHSVKTRQEFLLSAETELSAVIFAELSAETEHSAETGM